MIKYTSKENKFFKAFLLCPENKNIMANKSRGKISGLIKSLIFLYGE